MGASPSQPTAPPSVAAPAQSAAKPTVPGAAQPAVLSPSAPPVPAAASPSSFAPPPASSAVVVRGRYDPDETGRVPIPESEARLARFISVGLVSTMVGEGFLRFTSGGQRIAARVGPVRVRLVSLPLLLASEYALCVHALPPPELSYRSAEAMALSAKLIPRVNPLTGQPFEHSPHAAQTQRMVPSLPSSTAAPSTGPPPRPASPGTAVSAPLPPLPPLQPAVPSWLYAASSGLAVGPFVELALALTGLRAHPRIQAALPFWRARLPIYVVSTALTTALTLAWESAGDDKQAQLEQPRR